MGQKYKGNRKYTELNEMKTDCIKISVTYIKLREKCIALNSLLQKQNDLQSITSTFTSRN